MIFFPALFVQALIVGALVLTGAAALALLVLIAIDSRHNRIW